MSGRYKGVQSQILKSNSLAIFSPCACHTLNLCGVQAAECCPEVITYFGCLQKLYNVFSSSPQRWSILRQHIDCALHSMSQTRWSARVDCVKPFAANITKLMAAIDEMDHLNLTPETRTDLRSLKSYMNTFECTVLSSIWHKVLTAINQRSLVLQARNATLDVEIANIKSLIDELKHLREQWQIILKECKIVAANLGIENEFQEKRRKTRKRQFDDSRCEVVELNAETQFKQQVFYMLIDCLIGSMTRRFDALNDLDKEFGFLYKYNNLDSEAVIREAKNFSKKYSVDVSIDLIDEISHLKSVHEANFGPDALTPMQLLNAIKKQKMETIFPNICIALRILCTIPVSVAEGERSFSALARIKNFLRSTMTQGRLSSLGTLALESEMARKICFKAVIDNFASKKARKAFIN